MVVIVAVVVVSVAIVVVGFVAATTATTAAATTTTTAAAVRIGPPNSPGVGTVVPVEVVVAVVAFHVLFATVAVHDVQHLR